MNKSIDGRAIGRVISDWNQCYPATPLRIDALTRDDGTIYSAQLGFPDGTNADFDVTEKALHAPAIFPRLLARRGPSTYSQGQWMLFDELSDGAFRLVTERLGGAWDADALIRQKLGVLAWYSRR